MQKGSDDGILHLGLLEFMEVQDVLGICKPEGGTLKFFLSTP
jgi:hypothetical protein